MTNIFNNFHPSQSTEHIRPDRRLSLRHLYLLMLLICLLTNARLSLAQTFSWAKVFGGPRRDIGVKVAVDGSGNIFNMGIFQGAIDVDPGPATSILTAPDYAYNIFVCKLDASGNFIWAKQIGGGDVGCSGFFLDGSGNMYFTGSFSGTVDFDPGDATFNLTSAADDAFVCKLDASGNFVWAKQMGGTKNESPFDLTVDGSGNIYTTGTFRGTADFDPGPATFNLITTGSEDFNETYVSKLDASGNFVWAKSIGGTLTVEANALTVDGSGNVYITGRFSGTADFDPGEATFNLNSVAEFDIFVNKLDVSGNFVWAKQIGSTGLNLGRDITVDGSGNVYTTGQFQNIADFDPGPATFILTTPNAAANGQDYDIFISKLDASGNFVWAKHMGGTRQEECNQITLDAFGNIYTTGYFKGTADFDPGESVVNLTSAGISNIFVSKLDASGNFVWAKSMGGTLYSQGNGLAVDGSGNIYITGTFEGTADFNPGEDSFKLTSVGGSVDAFLIKLENTDVSVTLSPAAAPTTVCAGGSVSLSATTTQGIPPYTYTWTAPPGGSITGSGSAVTGTISTTASGVQTFTVTVTDSGTSATTATKTVNVTVIGIDITSQPVASSLACVGGSVSVPVSASGAIDSYQWYKGDTPVEGQVSSTLNLMNLTLADAGAYKLVITGSCNSVTTTAFQLTVSETLGITAWPAASSAVCAGVAVSVPASVSGTGAIYQWYKGTTPVVSQTTSTLSLTNPAGTDTGSYSLVVTGGCNSVTTSAFSLSVTEVGNVTQQPASGSAVCVGGAISIPVTVTGSVASYQWYSGTTPVATMTTNTLSLTGLSVADGGNYRLVATMTTCGSVTSNAFSLTVITLPTINISAFPAPTVLPGTSVTLTASGADSYLWSANANSTAGASVVVSTTGVYSVTGTASGCSNSASIQLKGCDQTIIADAVSITQTAVLGPDNCSVQLTGTGYGTSFTITGPDGYVFSAVYRKVGSYAMNGLNVKQPGSYTFKVSYQNACGEISYDTMTYVVTGTACK